MAVLRQTQGWLQNRRQAANSGPVKTTERVARDFPARQTAGGQLVVTQRLQRIGLAHPRIAKAVAGDQIADPGQQPPDRSVGRRESRVPVRVMCHRA